MTYRDNEVYFTNKAGGASPAGGSYTIESSCVTGGQDPEGRVSAGKAFKIYNDTKLCFSVGRKKSADVARWFNDRVPEMFTTFGHKADELNFALIGCLILKFSDGASYTFNGISFAQGQAGANNNWWFGGKTCRNIGDNKVECLGTDSSGKNCKFVFLRGGNAVNEVQIISIEKNLTADWMGNLQNDGLSLRELSIPGTHNSGTQLTGAGPAHCQNFNIERQLKDGIRFLDIRVKLEFGKLNLYHGIAQCYIDLDQVLVWCKAFLSAHPRETILMSVNREGGGDIAQRFRQYVENYDSLFLKTSKVPTLGEARGKIVLFKRFPFNDFGVDWTSWSDNAEFNITTPAGDKFHIEDYYKSYDTNVKLGQVRQTLSNAVASANKGVFYVTFNSIAWGFGHHTPYQYAWGGSGVNPAMNPALTDYLNGSPGKKRWGLVILDFYNDEGDKYQLVEKIIQANA